MRGIIKEHLYLSSEDKVSLGKTATFVFDTNTLLDLYRYSQTTRELLLSSIKRLENRVFLPYQVVDEFMDNRCEILLESASRYDSIKEDFRNVIQRIRLALKLEENDKSIKELELNINKWIEEKQGQDLLIADPYDDTVLNELMDIFENRVGQKYSDKELEELYKEGEERFTREVPPGYKDKKKTTNKYGDLVIWKQIMDYSKKEEKDIIFVTSDNKSDWWLEKRGKTIGPRIELNREFYTTTGHVFFMYTLKSFLEIFSVSRNDKAIFEIEMNEVHNRSDYEEYICNYKFRDYEISKKLEKINNEIEKNVRTQKYLDALYKKYPNEPRPENIQELINNSECQIEKRKQYIDNYKKHYIFNLNNDDMIIKYKSS